MLARMKKGASRKRAAADIKVTTIIPAFFRDCSMARQGFALLDAGFGSIELLVHRRLWNPPN
jgi:hypothetical protein